MRPARARWDAGRRGARGKALVYTSEEIEIVSLVRAVKGLRTVKAAHDFMCGDESEHGRELLGFDNPRWHPPKRGNRHKRRLEGIPSTSTVSRYVKAVDMSERAEAWERWKHAVGAVYFDRVKDRFRVLYGDGCHVRLVGKCPIYPPNSNWVDNYSTRIDSDTGETVEPVNRGAHRPQRPASSSPGRNSKSDI